MQNIDEITEPIEDFVVVGLVYRKWWNPLRYILGKQDKRKAIVKLIPKPN